MQENILHDNEDDNVNVNESLNYYAHFGVDNIKEALASDKKEELDFNIKEETDYHNSYYLGNHKYGRREIKMSNKAWHKLQLANGLVQNEQGIYV